MCLEYGSSLVWKFYLYFCSPWVNNCIGFWNRKYFMLLLLYVLLSIYFAFLTMIPAFIDTIQWHINVSYATVSLIEFIKVGIIEIVFAFITFLSVLMTLFIKFHIKLVIKNITTVESLEKKGTNFKSPVSK